MAKKSHAHLLEVMGILLEPMRWEWRVYEGDSSAVLRTTIVNIGA